MTDYERLKREFNLSLLGKGEKGDKGDPGLPGEKGDKGDKGDKGEPGEGLSGLQVGGRNLLRLTNRGTTGWRVNTDDAVTTLTAYAEEDGAQGICLTVEQPPTGWLYLDYSLAPVLPMLKPHTAYRVSFDVKSDRQQDNSVVLMRGNATGILTNSHWYQYSGDGQWMHVSAPLTTNDLSERDYELVQVLYFGIRMGTEGYLCIKNLKLEQGNVETAWTPAPEDAQTDIVAMVDRLWPIGSIYLSVDATDPAARWGGTWTRIENAFLLAASPAHPAGERGGEESHTLTVGELPAHAHDQAPMQYGNDWLGTPGQWSASSSGSTTHQYTTAATGGGAAHNNMPPYMAVYVWQRTG